MPEWKKYKNGCYETICNNMNEVIDIYNITSSCEYYLYRGHSKIKEYKLISSIDREISKYAIENDKITQEHLRRVLLNFILEDFTIKLKKYYDKIDFESNEQIWALGQHYGLKTPYLDWSKDFFIAAFFSSVDNTNHDGCIYILNTKLINEINNKIKLQGPDINYSELRIINKPDIFNSRQSMQKGCFTLTPSGISVDSWINTFKEYKAKPVLQRIVIPKNLKNKVINYLYGADTDYSKIYPDIQGICMSSNLFIPYAIKNFYGFKKNREAQELLRKEMRKDRELRDK